VLFLVNGDERRRVDQVTAADGQLNATLSVAGSTLSARVVGPRLDGEVRLVRPDGGREQLLFRAVLGQSWRFFENPSTDNADIAGRWAVSYVGEKGAQATSTVVFRQSFERVTGSFGGVAGAGGLLAGEMRGDELHLSRFDGETAILLRARVAADGTMTGEYWALGTGHRRFRAVRGPDS